MPPRTEGGNASMTVCCANTHSYSGPTNTMVDIFLPGMCKSATTASGNTWMALCLNPIPN